MPQTPVVMSLLKRVSSFANLPPDLLQVLAQSVQWRSYAVGEVLFQQGELTRGTHIIVQGRGRLVQSTPTGGQVLVGDVVAGDVLNQGALNQEGYQSASLMVLEPIQAIFLTRDSFNNLLVYHPRLKEALSIAPQHPQAQRPKKSFEQQRENETVLLKTNRHWWVWARFLWIPLVLVGVALALGVALGGFAWLITAFIIFCAIVLSLYMYLEWANDSVIITDQRVVRKTEHLLRFEKKLIEIKLDSVQEVKIVDPGLDPFSELFGYGTLSLITAGNAGNLRLSLMPNPDSIQALIMREHARTAQGGQQRDVQAMRADLERWIQYGGQTPNPNAPTDPRTSDPLSEPSRQDVEIHLPRNPFITDYALADGSIVYRQHWFIWLQRQILPSLILLAGVLVGLFGGVLGLGIISLSLAAFLIVIGGVFWWYRDWDFRNDYMILSDRTVRIIHERPLWLDSDNEEILLSRVDNVIVEIRGLWRQLLNFGDLKMSLQGADDYKPFVNMRQPKAIQQEIMRRQAAVKQRQQQQNEDAQRQMIGNYLQLYHQMLTGQSGTPAANMPALPSEMAWQGGGMPDSYQNQYAAMQQAGFVMPSPPSERVSQATVPTAPAQLAPNPEPRLQRPSLSSGRPYESPTYPNPAPTYPNEPEEYPQRTQPARPSAPEYPKVNPNVGISSAPSYPKPINAPPAPPTYPQSKPVNPKSAPPFPKSAPPPFPSTPPNKQP